VRYDYRVPGGVEPSNLHKVFWPELGLTKGDLLAYVEAVSPYLLPALRDRPLTVIRFPDGVAGPSFYQKQTPDYAPAWIRRVRLPASTKRGHVDYTVATSAKTLKWLANQAVIEFHPWTARADSVGRPDQLVFDLDPPEDGFAMAVEAALLLKDVLAGLGLEGTPKTTGSKGVHVYVPLVRRADYGRVRAAAEAVGAMMAERAPSLVTTEFFRKDRGGRVFLDPGRNAPGAHVASVYSPRARPGATVSFPVPWADLEKARTADFTLTTVPPILAAEGDRWRNLMPPAQTLPRSLGA
jgi:bifunctional non-homologous end joining protein LigD